MHFISFLILLVTTYGCKYVLWQSLGHPKTITKQSLGNLWEISGQSIGNFLAISRNFTAISERSQRVQKAAEKIILKNKYGNCIRA